MGAIYTEDEFLMLSGIQHIAFCERQYALAYIEMQWEENVSTVEGHHLHEHCDDPFYDESRKDLIIMRSVPLISKRLGLTGRADVVELCRSDDMNTECTIAIDTKQGRWYVMPVEYKRGKPKPDECDEVQLCAQAYALEEAYNIIITKGYLYYGETRHRHEVFFSDSLRAKTGELALRMHELFQSGVTPAPVPGKRCNGCSLVNICIPRLKTTYGNVNRYLELNLDIP